MFYRQSRATSIIAAASQTRFPHISTLLNPWDALDEPEVELLKHPYLNFAESLKTSKSKYRSAADFDLTKHSLLLPLLEAVPLGERTGAVVKGAKGLPVRRDMYARWFRQIARAAGIPDDVWNMDTRAGGATEADEAGATIEAIQSALTHDRPDTTQRYIRRGHSKKIGLVPEARGLRRAEKTD